MEATDLADDIKQLLETAARTEVLEALEVSAGYEEADFFVDVAGERFLVAVMKVSE